jgi:hypothetical protein
MIEASLIIIQMCSMMSMGGIWFIAFAISRIERRMDARFDPLTPLQKRMQSGGPGK